MLCLQSKENKHHCTEGGAEKGAHLDHGIGWTEGCSLPKTVNQRQRIQVFSVTGTGRHQPLCKNLTSVPAEATAGCRWLWDTSDFRDSNTVKTKVHLRIQRAGQLWREACCPSTLGPEESCSRRSQHQSRSQGRHTGHRAPGNWAGRGLERAQSPKTPAQSVKPKGPLSG